MKLQLKFFDVLIILIAVSLIILSTFSTYINQQGITQVLIQGQNSEWVFNIDAEEKVTVTGPIGETVIRTGGGVVWVESSPCDNQNCMAAGFLKKPGQWTACMPNHVLIMIKSPASSRRRNEEVDAVTQ